jgi:hypothetical protein
MEPSPEKARQKNEAYFNRFKFPVEIGLRAPNSKFLLHIEYEGPVNLMLEMTATKDGYGRIFHLQRLAAN